MRVLHLTTSFPLNSENIAGIFILELAKSLKNKNIDVEVVAPHANGSQKHEILEGIKVKRLQYFLPAKWQKLCYNSGMPTNLKRSHLAKFQLPILGSIFLIYTIIQEKQYDLIHAHWNFAGLAAIIAGTIRNIPVVINIHHGQNNRKISKLDKFVIENADNIVCNSSFNKNQILRHCNPKSCSVISPGVDCSKFMPSKTEACKNLINNKVVLFAVGRLIEWKGFKFLLEATSKLKNKINNFHLYLAGDGPEKNNLEQLARDHALENNISFLGNIPNKDIVSYYQCAHIFVLPSIIDQKGNTEGLGVVLLEAMACGVPCIASNVGGIPDIVHHNYNGFLVEPKDSQAIADKMEVLITNKDTREKMGEQARSFVEKEYDWSIKANQLKDLYNKINT